MKLPVRLFFSPRTLTIGVHVAETRFTYGVALSVGLRSNLGPGADAERGIIVWNPGTVVAFTGTGADAAGDVTMRFLRRTWPQPRLVETETTLNRITPRTFRIAFGPLR